MTHPVTNLCGTSICFVYALTENLIIAVLPSIFSTTCTSTLQSFHAGLVSLFC